MRWQLDSVNIYKLRVGMSCWKKKKKKKDPRRLAGPTRTGLRVLSTNLRICIIQIAADDFSVLEAAARICTISASYPISALLYMLRMS